MELPRTPFLDSFQAGDNSEVFIAPPDVRARIKHSVDARFRDFTLAILPTRGQTGKRLLSRYRRSPCAKRKELAIAEEQYKPEHSRHQSAPNAFVIEQKMVEQKYLRFPAQESSAPAEYSD